MLSKRSTTVVLSAFVLVAGVCLATRFTKADALDLDDLLNSGRRSMKGLKGVVVLVEILPPDLRKRGITEDHLRALAELSLRRAGVPVLSSQARQQSQRQPYLYINVAGYNVENFVYWHARVELIQFALLPDVHEVVDASTWHNSMLGLAGTMRVKDSIEGTIRDYMDEFCNLYLAANPVAAPQPAQGK